MNSYVLDDNARRLVEENMRLVPYALATRYGHSAASDDDMLSVGYIGLCRAAATFRPEDGVKFCTYAYKCILSHVYTERRKILTDSRRANLLPLSLNRKVQTDDPEGEEEFIDMLPDQSEDVERDAINRVFIDAIKEYIPICVQREAGDLTFEEIARQTGISKQGIHQKYKKELERARNKFRGVRYG